jgi:hypothetical protein
MKRAVVVLACLTAGHAVAAGLFWALLNVPESNILMLALSALVVVLLVVVLGWVETTALLAWDPAVPIGRAARRGMTTLPSFVCGLMILTLVWVVTARAELWHGAHSGEIDAWWMSRTGSAKTAWIHRGCTIALWLVRYVAGVSLAVSALGAGARHGARALAATGWLLEGLAPRRLGAIGLAVAALVLVPLQMVYWRPVRIPPSSVEAVFVTAKLLAIYLAVNVGWALVLREAARRPAPASSQTTPFSAASSPPWPS